jgi:uncharacterized protein HemX
MDSILPVLTAATLSIAAAVATFVFARRLGLTSVQREAAFQETRLVATLKDRMALLEEENRQLREEVARLERRYERLERDYEELLRRVEKVTNDAR